MFPVASNEQREHRSQGTFPEEFLLSANDNNNPSVQADA
jgi:hypothetical protein